MDNSSPHIVGSLPFALTLSLPSVLCNVARSRWERETRFALGVPGQMSLPPSKRTGLHTSLTAWLFCGHREIMAGLRCSAEVKTGASESDPSPSCLCPPLSVFVVVAILLRLSPSLAQ